ncbi:hypothetical protein T439DRAFT_361117 [Meredithblackwellia eburnea MCA 4105]
MRSTFQVQSDSLPLPASSSGKAVENVFVVPNETATMGGCAGSPLSSGSILAFTSIALLQLLPFAVGWTFNFFQPLDDGLLPLLDTTNHWTATTLAGLMLAIDLFAIPFIQKKRLFLYRHAFLSQATQSVVLGRTFSLFAIVVPSLVHHSKSWEKVYATPILDWGTGLRTFWMSFTLMMLAGYQVFGLVTVFKLRVGPENERKIEELLREACR